MSELTTRTVVELAQLQTNNTYLKGYVQDEISKAVASGLKTVTISGNTLSFYDVDEPVGESKPKYSIELPETDLTDINKALATIQGDENTEGSIKAIAKAAADSKDEAIAEAKKSGDDAQKDVDALEELVGTIPEDATAKTVVDYAKEVADKASGDASQVASDLASEVTRATGEEEALGKRIDGVEETIGEIEEGSTVAAEISKAQKTATDYTDEKVAALGAVLKWNGQVDTIDDLPTEDVKKGDVYNVKTTSKGTSAEYVYNGEDWEELGTNLDLSAYAVKADVSTDIATAKSEAISAAESYTDDKDSAMNTRVQALESAVGEGGSVETQITTAIEGLDATVSQEAGDDGVSATVVETDGKLTSVSVSIAANTYDSYGAADAVQDNLDDFVGSISYATDAQIAQLWGADTTTEEV
jgi:hypothetical protein